MPELQPYIWAAITLAALVFACLSATGTQRTKNKLGRTALGLLWLIAVCAGLFADAKVARSYWGGEPLQWVTSGFVLLLLILPFTTVKERPDAEVA